MSRLVPHFTPAKRAGAFTYVSGQMAFTAPGEMLDGDIEAQLEQCIRNIEAALATVDAGLEDIVKNMVWLVNTEDFPAFNAAYAQYFPGEPPARATVCSALMVPGAVIEIESIAYKPI